ncbi:PAS domain-containing sensor histidine kinase [Natrinema halophilum]|uniref:histidine kinase n=1 Tax=Natrinema halophilum TaxID=1699371 RepID=A0A7D5KJF8_9EURY|nr:PAS domain S-box protein [Natrinema halophilum]QLG49399.1 PAS domain S-box protein [Natrinema halophilum]
MCSRAGATTEAFCGDVSDDVALNRYRTLVETIDDGIYQLDSDGHFVAVTDVIVEMTGYPRDELLGEHVSLVLTDDDIDRIERETENLLDTDETGVATFETAVQTANGGTFPCELRITPLIEEEECQGTIGVARDISEETKRPATSESTRASYDSITSVLDEANIGVFIINDKFEVASANETIEQYLDLDRETLIGRDKRRVVRENVLDKIDDPDRFAETVLATYGDNSYIEEFECHVAAGDDREERWLEHWSKPIESGQYAGGRIELYYDITDRKRSEDALQDTTERFHSLVDAVEEYAIFRLDRDGHIISWNEGAREIKGYDRDEILGKSFSTFYTEEDRAAGVPEHNLEQATKAGSIEDEGWRIRKDGSRFWANVTITSIWDGDDTHRGYLKVTRDMTDRHEREQELENELQRILHRISDAFYAVDEDFRFTHVNERAEDLLQYSEEELLGKNHWDVFPAVAGEDEVRTTFQTAMNSQEAMTIEFYDESFGFWVEANLYPSESGVSVYFRNVTERKERERELTKYETIVETVNDGIYTVDENGRFTMVNEAYTELTGYSREELLGSHVSLVVDDETIERATDLEAEMAAGTVDKPMVETVIETADGGQVHSEATFSLLPDDDRVRIGVARDVTERKERERALEESERRYRTLVEHFPNGAVGLYDEALTYTVAGGEILAELDISSDEVVGTSIYERYSDDVIEEIKPHFRAVFDGESRTFEMEYRGRHLVGYTLPVRNADDEIYAGMLMMQDISERMEYRRKLEKSNERLEQFAYAASHDLQEPLRMVTSYLQLIDQRYGDALDEDGEEFLEFAVDGAERMREMIDGLLTYSRVETNGDPFGVVDLNVIVENVREDLQIQIEESDAEITTDNLPHVEGDASQLRQVFQNLLSNAIEYSGDQPPRVDITTDRDGSDWVISVRDEGVGIETDDQKRIFEVFQRLHTRREHAGTGIGLALCRRIVERHGGEIWVEAEPGVGSTFSFTLPAARDCDE